MAISFSIGVSNLENPFSAGQSAAAMAVSKLPEPDTAIVFGSIFYDQSELLSGICTRIPSDIIIGGSSYGEISPAGVCQHSVVILLIKMPERNSIRSVCTKIAGSSRDYGEKLALAMKSVMAGVTHPSPLLLLACSWDGRENDALNSITAHLGPSPIFGGLFCGNYGLGIGHPEFFTNYQYVAGQVQQHHAILSLLSFPEHDFRISYGFGHGWNPASALIRITKAEEGNVYEVNGVPVFDFYRRLLNNEEPSGFFEQFIQRYGFALHHSDNDDFSDTVIKAPVAYDEQKGFIRFAPTEDLHNKQVRLVQGGRKNVISGAKMAAEKCVESLGGYKPELVIAVSCCSRATILHSRLNLEIEAIQKVFGQDVPIFGYYSGGEIAPYKNRYEDIIQADYGSESVSGGHGMTVALMAIGTPSGSSIKKYYPGSEALDLSRNQSIEQLKAMLQKSEEILDDTELLLNNLNCENWQNVEKISQQNEILNIRNTKLLQANQKNQMLQKIIRRYTPHEIWERVGVGIEQGDYELQEQFMERAFMFLDVKGFTSFSEKNSPETVIKELNNIFSKSTEIIYEYHGDVDKFIGDCIFAVFHTTENAVQAAYSIQKVIRARQPQLPFSLRIGINMGSAIRGNVGSQNRREYTFIGDAVNLAQRLESNCPPGKILVSESVFNDSSMPFSQILRRELSVKGKSETVIAYECEP